MFSLCLCPQWKNAEATWLKLPYSIQEKEQVLAILGIDSLKECVITQIRSAVPTFEYTMSEDTDIEKLNQLARQLDALPVDELIKYKAILESNAFGGLGRVWSNWEWIWMQRHFGILTLKDTEKSSLLKTA